MPSMGLAVGKDAKEAPAARLAGVAVRAPVASAVAVATTVGTPVTTCVTVCVRLGCPLGTAGAEKVAVGTGVADAYTRLRAGVALAAVEAEGRTWVRVGETPAEGEGGTERSAVGDAVPRTVPVLAEVRESEGDAPGEREAVQEEVEEGERRADADSVPRAHAAVMEGEGLPVLEGSEAEGALLPLSAFTVAVGGKVTEEEGLLVAVGALAVGLGDGVPPMALAVGKGAHEPSTRAGEAVGGTLPAALVLGAPVLLLLPRGDALGEPESSLDGEGKDEAEGEREVRGEGVPKAVAAALRASRAVLVARALLPVGWAVGGFEGGSAAEGRAERDAEGKGVPRGDTVGERVDESEAEGARVLLRDTEGCGERDMDVQALRVAVRTALPLARTLPVGAPTLRVGGPGLGVRGAVSVRDAVATAEGRALLEEDLEGAGEPLWEAHADRVPPNGTF